MGGVIYLIRDDEELVEMTEQEYDSEALLQELLAKYPKLLAGDQMDGDQPRRWLFISREEGVPDEEGGSDRWAVDHLFLDQDGIPTLVEVKRSSDTRIRREVVGQMLDYAANAVVHWPVERIQSQFEEHCRTLNRNADEKLAEFLDSADGPEGFWERVETNMQARKVRMVFVADKIPSELQRIVEFLNRQMDPAEVFAVEIKQFLGEGLTTLVPRVVGQVDAPKPSTSRWDKDRLFAALGTEATTEEVALAEDLLRFGAEVSGRPVEWGTGKQRGSFTARLVISGQRFSLFSVYTTHEFSLNFGWNHERLGSRGAKLSEKYRSRTDLELGLEFDQRKWEFGDPMSTLSKLHGDGIQAFKSLVTAYVAEATGLVQEETQ